MDLGNQLIFLVIFGLIGFVIGYFTGFNPYNLYSNIGAIIILVPVFYILIRTAINPDLALDSLNNVINWFVNNLPGIVIGDVAGAIIGGIVSEK